MNLDKQINVIRKNALKNHSLDVVDNNLLRYGDIYSDIMEEADRIKEMSANDYFKIRFRLKKTAFITKTKYVVKQYLVYPIWKRMPDGIKNGIRRLLKRVE